jgi:plastocyanin
MKNPFDTSTAIRRMLIASLFLIALLMGAFGISCRPQGSTPQQTEVVIEGFAFNPAEINVPVGSSVTWSNQDSMTHTITARDNTFDSGNLPSGGTFNYTFEEKGTFEYSCTIHPNMEGRVIVE